MATDPSPAPQPLSAVSAPLPVGARLGDIARRLSADRAVLLLAGITGVAGLSTFLVVPLLPLFASRLDAGPAQIGLLTAAFALASAAAQLVVGGRIDRLGPRTWLVGGAIVSSLAACLIALAGDAGSLVVWRGLVDWARGPPRWRPGSTSTEWPTRPGAPSSTG